MLINDKLLKENFTESEYNKIQTLKQIYITQMSRLKTADYKKFLNTLNIEERDLIEKGILSDEVIQNNLQNGTNCDRSFRREDGVFIEDTFQTTFMIMFQKIVSELDTIFFFNNLGDRFELKANPEATSIKGVNITSEPDFVLYDNYTEEIYYIEQKAFYFGKSDDGIKLKQWQYKRLETQYVKQNKNVMLMNKIYDKDFNITLDFYYLNNITSDKQTWYQEYDERDYQWVFTSASPVCRFKQNFLEKKLVNLINNEEVPTDMPKEIEQREPIIIAF